MYKEYEVKIKMVRVKIKFWVGYNMKILFSQGKLTFGGGKFFQGRRIACIVNWFVGLDYMSIFSGKEKTAYCIIFKFL